MNTVLSNMMSLLSLSKTVFVFTAYLIFLCALFLPLIFYGLRLKHLSRRKREAGGRLRVAFFHPYCNAGGGGERVLWVAVQALQRRYPEAEYYVYTGDVGATPDEILARAGRNLNVELAPGVKFVYLTRRKYVEAPTYPYFTLLGQSLGSVCLGYEALDRLNPDVFIDTTGYAFTLPLFKYIGGCRTGCYVHYPTITVEMLKRVSARQVAYNNRRTIARSPFLTAGKLLYYRLFAWLYSLAGDCADVPMVNSTFTLEHLGTLWGRPLRLVYPPCDVGRLKRMPRRGALGRDVRVLSLAQFRPEKDHQLQMQAMYELREIVPEEQFARVTLVLCGGCRDAADAARVADLRDFSRHLSLEGSVEFRVNATYDELLRELETASVGLHTMIDEHFGIGVVELMAAGLVTIAHRSGGPLLDIVETSESSRLGFLAVSAEDYAHAIKYVLAMSEESVMQLIDRARASVDRFSNAKFQDGFLRAVEPLFK